MPRVFSVLPDYGCNSLYPNGLAADQRYADYARYA